MGTLEEKLATLRDGTEAVSEVLKNWSNVLGVLSMVGKELPKVISPDNEDASGSSSRTVKEGTLPGTLVRIPAREVAGGVDEERGLDGG